MLTKPLISSNLQVPYEFGPHYLVKMACLINWATPGSLPPSFIAGGVCIVLLLTGILVGKLPIAVRMGAYLTLVSLAPFPFVWIQKTFIWLPSVGLCLVVAGILQYLFSLLPVSRFSAYLKAALPACLLLAMAAWGYNEGRREVDLPIAVKLAVEQLSDTQNGPVYYIDTVLESMPGLVPLFAYNCEEPEVTYKNRMYLQHLLQLHTMNRTAVIAWQ